MKSIKLTVLLVSIFILLQIVACGGSGNSGETNEPDIVSQEPPLPDLHTKDLVAPENFDFRTSREVTVNIRLPELNTRRAFVSIFTQYSSTTNAEWRPDFDSRLVMEKLQSGEMQRAIQLTHDVQIVLIQVWTDNRLEPPYSMEVPVVNNQINWLREFK